MKKIILLVLLAAIGAGAYLYWSKTSGEDFQLEDGYTLLYDGDSLAGWRVIGGESTFAAQGQDIVGRHGPGKNTFLRTDKSFGDFNLRMQMRWDEPGNSGVLFRAQQRNDNGRAYGYQFELDHSERAWSGGVYDEARRGWLANLENNQAAREAIRLDDWNDIEIEARGVSLKTWINGVPAANIVDGLDAEGFIALQVHSGNSGVMRWRNIRLKELQPMSAVGSTLLSPIEWPAVEVGSLQFDDDGFGGSLPAEDVWLEPRRKFSEAMLRMTVPACESPTTIQMRYRIAENSKQATFAEVKIYADRAEARLVSRAGERVLEPVALPKADRHSFVGLSAGSSVVLTIGEVDALRMDETSLDDRGQLRIRPARCGEAFRIGALEWFSLKETSAEPLFYQTLEVPPAPVLSPEEALGAFSIAPGFEIELVAAEPLIEDPVAMAWDEHGRLYVVEMRGYMPDAYGTGREEPVGQVVRLTDVDGDGRMDSSEVFLGELVNPRAVAVVNEGVLIGEPPNLWLCELPTPDVLCENKHSVGGYATDVSVANVEHMENGLRQGLDNWLYNAKSARRLKLENGAVVEQEGLFRGQWGITRDAYGRWLYNHNSTWLQADMFQAEDLVLPGVQGYPDGLGVNLTEPAEVFSVRVNPGVNRAYLDNTLREDGRLHKATGVSGLVAYRGDQFPAEYATDVFVPESAGNVVAQFKLTEEGMALAATQRLYDDERWGKRDFLGSTDERFRPVDAMNGPDGALYIIDMYRGIIQDDHFLTDELREQIFQRGLEQPVGLGRIWRIRHSDGKTTPAASLADVSTEELVVALSHPNGWVRDTAQRLLLGSEASVTDELAELALTGETVPSLHALWTLSGRGELQRDLLRQIATLQDLQRQLHALRVGRGVFTAEDLLSLKPAYAEAPAALRMQLAFALGDHSNRPDVRAALGEMLNAEVENVYIRQAVVRAVYGEELPFLAEWLADGGPNAASDAGPNALSALAANAYRSLRGDFGSADEANPRLLELLALAESRREQHAWQQIALLKGFQSVTAEDGFVPAHFASAPPIFADTSISDKDPLWNARLAGRAAFTWPGDELALGIKPLSPEQLKLMEQGQVFYVQCAACHGDNGKGVTGLAPALAGASWVTGPPEWLGRIILQGMTGPVEVNGEVFEGVMPPHGHIADLDDATLAGLMTYLRRTWGNKADPVSEAMVAEIRKTSAARSAPWTAQELQTVAYDRGFSRFVGKYTVSFVTITVSEKADGLHMNVPMYGGGLLEQVSDTVFKGTAGGQSARVEFEVDENGAVPRMMLYTDGQKIPVKKKD